MNDMKQERGLTLRSSSYERQAMHQFYIRRLKISTIETTKVEDHQQPRNEITRFFLLCFLLTVLAVALFAFRKANLMMIKSFTAAEVLSPSTLPQKN